LDTHMEEGHMEVN